MTRELEQQTNNLLRSLNGEIGQEADKAMTDLNKARRIEIAARERLENEGKALVSLARRILRPYLKDVWDEVTFNSGYVIDYSTRPRQRKPYIEVKILQSCFKLHASIRPRHATTILKLGKQIRAAIDAFNNEPELKMTLKRVK